MTLVTSTLTVSLLFLPLGTAHPCDCQNATQALESLASHSSPGNAVHGEHDIGWAPGPPTRGAMDIVWTCLSAIALVTWSNLCLNLPKRIENWLSIHWRRAYWMLFSIYCPDLVMATAFGQYLAINKSVNAYRRAGFWNWTDRHAFFADMGGIELQPKDSKPFRISSNHLLYLIENRYLEYPELSLEEIKDKSKKDTLAKLIMLIQIGYVIVQAIAR